MCRLSRRRKRLRCDSLAAGLVLLAVFGSMLDSGDLRLPVAGVLMGIALVWAATPASRQARRRHKRARWLSHVGL